MHRCSRAVACIILCLLLLPLLSCVAAEKNVQQPSAAPSAAPAAPPVQENVPSIAPKAPPKALTLMVYMVGSNLESEVGAATADLLEMAESGVDTDAVNLVVCTGGATEWKSDLPTDQNAILQFEGDAFAKRELWELRSMGDPTLLSDYLSYCYEQYPADSYALIFWDHGFGPIDGFGRDKLFDDDCMTSLELCNALSDSPFGDERKLEWIGFDACLMCSVEMAVTLSDHAKCLIASQELEPYFGWDYAFLDRYAPGQTGEETAGFIIDAYMAACKTYFEAKPSYRKDVTLTCLDLSKAKAAQQALGDLFTAMRRDILEGAYSGVARLRQDVRAIQPRSTNQYDLVDIESLASVYGGSYPAEAGALTAALNDMIVTKATNVDDLSGVSLWFPFSNKEEYPGNAALYHDLKVSDDVSRFLDDYSSILLDDTQLSDWTAQKGAALELSPDGGFYWQLTKKQAENVALAAYYIFEKRGDEYYLLLGSRDVLLDEKDRLSANYDGTIPCIYNEDNGEYYYGYVREDARDVRYATYSILCSTTEFDPAVNGIADKMTLLDLRVRENLLTNELELLDAVPQDEDDGKTPFLLTDPKYQDLSFYFHGRFIKYDKEGHVLPYFDWDYHGYSFSRCSANDRMHAERRPLPAPSVPDSYYCQIIATDTQGNDYASALLPITVPVAEPEPLTIPSAAKVGYAPRPVVSTTYQPDAETLQPIYEDDLLELRLISITAQSDGVQWSFLVTNRSEYVDASLGLASMAVNDVYFNEYVSYTGLEPGVPALCCVSLSARDLLEQGIDRIRSARFTLSFSSRYRNGSAQTDTICIRSDIDVSHVLSAQLEKEAAENAGIQTTELLNGRQRLFSVSGLTATMLSLVKSDDDLQYTIKVTNDTELPLSVLFDQIIVNEIQLQYGSTFIDAIHPGGSRIITGQIRASDLTPAVFASVRRLQMTPTIRYRPADPYMLSKEYYPGAVTVETKLAKSDADVSEAPGDVEAAWRLVLDREGVRIRISDPVYGTIIPYVTLEYCVQNNSPQAVTVSTTDIRINGNLSKESWGFTGIYMQDPLASGSKLYKQLNYNLERDLQPYGITELLDLRGKLTVLNGDNTVLLEIDDFVLYHREDASRMRATP